jgi:hypothetical protein
MRSQPYATRAEPHNAIYRMRLLVDRDFFPDARMLHARHGKIVTCKLLEPEINHRNVEIVSNLTAATQIDAELMSNRPEDRSQPPRGPETTRNPPI